MIPLNQLQFDEGMAVYASPAQKKYLLRYLNSNCSVRETARSFGCHHKTVAMALRRLHEKCQTKGYSAEHGMDFPVPDMFFMERLTLNTDANGQIKQAWPKLKIDDLRWMNFVRQRMERVFDDYPVPAIPSIPSPGEGLDKDIVSIFNIGDAHLNMLAHLKETGRDFDLDQAALELRSAFDIFIAESPARERCLINDLGDFTHHENTEGVTQAHRNLLDCDQPFSSMIDVSVETMEYLIVRCLEKHQFVDVAINQGNHSRTNDLWMAVYLRRTFRNNPRVTILDNTRIHIPYRVGNSLILSHHSDKTSIKNLIDVMLTDYRRDFGETQFHYIYTGHIHHRMTSKEYSSVEAESFNNLAPNDKHHFEAGYRSKNSITRIDMHRRFGERGRRRIGIEEILEHTKQTDKLPDLPVMRV